MAVAAGKIKTLWSVFVCLIFLVLYVNWAGPVWDQLDMAIATPLQKQPRNSSDAILVFGRSRRFLTSTAENVSTLTSEHTAMQRDGTSTSLSYRDSCTKPVTNFVFIKVHKTASASTAVILLRFAYKHHMIMCFSPRRNIRFALTFPSTEIYKTNCTRWPLFGDHFNFLVHHTVFNKTAMDRVMKPGTKYIGIMREPQSHFRSQFFYRRKAVRYGLMRNRNPLGAFLDNPEHYEQKWTRNLSWSGERNNQAFTMGFPPDLLATRDTMLMDNAIKQLGQSYTFVIINEYYEESLVMLRRRLCWGLSDILHSNKKIHEQDNPKKYIPFTDKQLENHRRINAIDYRMYDFFNRTFWRGVEEETGRGFWDEVAQFKMLLKRVNTYCSKVGNKHSLLIPAGTWNEPFSVNKSFCAGLEWKPPKWAMELFQEMMHDKIWKRLNRKKMQV